MEQPCLKIVQLLAARIKAESHADPFVLYGNAAEELHAEVGLSKEMTAYFINELCEDGFLSEGPMTHDFVEAPIGMTSKGYAAAESPAHFLNQPVNSSGVINCHDYVSGDKVMRDKFEGNRSVSQDSFKGSMTGVVGSSFCDDSKITGNTFQQISAPNSALLLKLVAVLSQTALQFPQEVQAELIRDIEDVAEKFGIELPVP